MAEANVFVVDDDPDVCALLARRITEAGYKATCAGSAEDALERLKTAPCDVVIADVLLPGMSGLELIGVARNEFKADVIIITGDVSEEIHADAIRKGASDFILKPLRTEELILRLRRVLEERENRRAYTRMINELHELSITDGLTGVYNARHFLDQLQIEASRAHRYGRPMTLMLTDMDGFKRVNDLHGHPGGDRLLTQYGRVLRSMLRTSDTAYRYGGDEFMIILAETALADGIIVGERIRVAVEAEHFQPLPDLTLTLSVSIGITEYQPAEKIAALIRRVDEAMYASKKKGGNALTSA